MPVQCAPDDMFDAKLPHHGPGPFEMFVHRTHQVKASKHSMNRFSVGDRPCVFHRVYDASVTTTGDHDQPAWGIPADESGSDFAYPCFKD